MGKPNILGFGMMSNDELKVWLKVLSTDSKDEEGNIVKAKEPQEILSELTLINRLLIVQKNFMLMNKKRNLGYQLEAVIDQHYQITKNHYNLNVKDR